MGETFHDTRTCIILIEFDVIKVSLFAVSLSPFSLPIFSPPPRNNYGLRCSVAFVSALHLYPLVLTCTNILVRIEEEEETVGRERGLEGERRGEGDRGRMEKERTRRVGGKVGLLAEEAETAAVR